MAGYNAHFDRESAITHEMGTGTRQWKFDANVVAGDFAEEAYAQYALVSPTDTP